MKCRCATIEELDGRAAQDYADAHLEKIEVMLKEWEIRYRCPSLSIEWLMDYPQSELHGGGPPRLRRSTWC